MLDNYDPNINNRASFLYDSDIKEIQTVEVTFQQWDYKKTIQLELNTNMLGSDCLHMAIDDIYEGLPVNVHGDLEIKYMNLKREADENILEVEDEDDIGSEWLLDMIVKFEIIKREKI